MRNFILSGPNPVRQKWQSVNFFTNPYIRRHRSSRNCPSKVKAIRSHPIGSAIIQTVRKSGRYKFCSSLSARLYLVEGKILLFPRFVVTKRWVCDSIDVIQVNNIVSGLKFIMLLFYNYNFFHCEYLKNESTFYFMYNYSEPIC